MSLLSNTFTKVEPSLIVKTVVIVKKFPHGVNFINILRENFLYKRCFGSQNDVRTKKFVRKTLMKLTHGGQIDINLSLFQVLFAKFVTVQTGRWSYTIQSSQTTSQVKFEDL
jgi:hypothetical protein